MNCPVCNPCAGGGRKLTGYGSNTYNYNPPSPPPSPPPPSPPSPPAPCPYTSDQPSAMAMAMAKAVVSATCEGDKVSAFMTCILHVVPNSQP